MSTLPKEERFAIDEHISVGLVAGQSVIINEKDYVVKYITLKKGTYERVLVATRVPRLRLSEVEK